MQDPTSETSHELAPSDACLTSRFVIARLLAPDWWFVLEHGSETPFQWGLVWHESHPGLDDMLVSWPTPPQGDPTADVSEDDEEALDPLMDGEDAPYWSYVRWIEETFEPALKMDPATGWALVDAARRVGYDPEVHGYRFSMWLAERCTTIWAQAERSNPALREFMAERLVPLPEVQPSAQPAKRPVR